MSRPYNPLSIAILNNLSQKVEMPFKELFKLCEKTVPQKTFGYKFFYNALFRLQSEGLITKSKQNGALTAKITQEGKQLLFRASPQKDGIWKIVIFDIPEKNKYIRNVLRAKLKALHFKKWQNSIWVTPYALDSEIEEEMKAMAKKFFVRLIKTTQINETEDLEKLFK